MYDILSLTISTLLTADMIILCTKSLYIIHDSHSPFRRKMCTLPQVRCHRPPIWPPTLPLNLTYIWLVPLKQMFKLLSKRIRELMLVKTAGVYNWRVSRRRNRLKVASEGFPWDHRAIVTFLGHCFSTEYIWHFFVTFKSTWKRKACQTASYNYDKTDKIVPVLY
jgi:hypothetical protein